MRKKVVPEVQLAAAKLPDDKRHLQQQTPATDRQIDRLVYELYGLLAEIEYL